MHTGKTFLLLTGWALAGCRQNNSRDNPSYFTGEIQYHYQYETNLLNNDSLNKARPQKGIFRYDTSGYFSSFEGADTVNYFYSGKYNRAISSKNNIPDSSCEDYGLVTDSVLSWKLYPSEMMIQDQHCDIIEIQKTRSWVRYYVSRKYSIAPAIYIRHRSYNWDFYGSKTNGGLILQLEHRFPSFTMKGFLQKLEPAGADFRAFNADTEAIMGKCD